MIGEYDALQTSDGTRLNVDECYTTTERALKYTLIHLENKKRLATIKKLMAFANTKYGVVKQQLFGYQSVSSSEADSDFYSHPSVKILLRDMERNVSVFSSWVKETKDKGLLQIILERRAGSIDSSNDMQVMSVSRQAKFDLMVFARGLRTWMMSMVNHKLQLVVVQTMWLLFNFSSKPNRTSCSVSRPTTKLSSSGAMPV